MFQKVKDPTFDKYVFLLHACLSIKTSLNNYRKYDTNSKQKFTYDFYFFKSIDISDHTILNVSFSLMKQE